MLTFPVMVFGVLIVLLVGADAARRQITGKTPALTRGRMGIVRFWGFLLLFSVWSNPKNERYRYTAIPQLVKPR